MPYHYREMVRASLIWLAIGIVVVLLMPPKQMPQPPVCNADCCLPTEKALQAYRAAGVAF